MQRMSSRLLAWGQGIGVWQQKQQMRVTATACAHCQPHSADAVHVVQVGRRQQQQQHEQEVY